MSSIRLQVGPNEYSIIRRENGFRKPRILQDAIVVNRGILEVEASPAKSIVGSSRSSAWA
ncbi:snf2 family dna-dependent atpase [Moniliophthora roreri]|nr:snf2 family dna-dependent atpase [Moniliophthora roreri]